MITLSIAGTRRLLKEIPDDDDPQELRRRARVRYDGETRSSDDLVREISPSQGCSPGAADRPTWLLTRGSSRRPGFFQTHAPFSFLIRTVGMVERSISGYLTRRRIVRHRYLRMWAWPRVQVSGSGRQGVLGLTEWQMDHSTRALPYSSLASQRPRSSWAHRAPSPSHPNPPTPSILAAPSTNHTPSPTTHRHMGPAEGRSSGGEGDWFTVSMHDRTPGGIYNQMYLWTFISCML